MKTIKIAFLLLVIASQSISAFELNVDTIILQCDSYKVEQLIVSVSNTENEPLWIWLDNQDYSQDERMAIKSYLMKRGYKFTYDDANRLTQASYGEGDRMDPLCEKYYEVSPYVYCANNPVRFIDTDGRKIVFAQDSSEEFKGYFWQAIDFLKRYNCGELYDILEEDEKVYVIKESTQQSAFSYESLTIEWAPLKGMYTESVDGYNFLSPATLLSHEFGHAFDKINSDGKINSNCDPSKLDEQYTNAAERSVILGVETKTAKALGELKSGEVTRVAYNGIRFNVSSPISNNFLDDNSESAKEIKGKMQMWNQ